MNNVKHETIVNDGSMYRYWLDENNKLFFTVMHQMGSKDGRTSAAVLGSTNARRAIVALLKNPEITHIVVNDYEIRRAV